MRRRRQGGSASHAGKTAKGKSQSKPVAGRRDTDSARAGNQAVERLVEQSRKANPERDVLQREAATDPAADAAAHLLDAEAATVHGHVVQRRDGPPKGSAPAQRLLSHELAHVLQQRAASSLRPEVGDHHGPHEAAAVAASRSDAKGAGSATGAVPAIQRQPKEGAEAKPDFVPTPHPLVQERLVGYLERIKTRQRAQSVQLTDEVKGDLRRLALNDVNTLMRLDAFLESFTTREPTAMAQAITKLLPDAFDPERSAYLEKLPVEEHKSTTDRAMDLVKKTEPYVSPEAQLQQWEFDRRAKEVRRNDDVIGPYGLDIQRAINIGLGLGDVFSQPKKKPPEPKALTKSTETVISGLDDLALVPKAARTPDQSGEYAIASDVARDVARRIAEAQRKRFGSITITLGENYRNAEDRFEIMDALERIVRDVARTMPNGGAPVTEVEVYLGHLRFRRIDLRKASP